MDEIKKHIGNLKAFQAFFKDTRNETIVNTIRKICQAGEYLNRDLTGEMFAYRAGAQDVWNKIQTLVNTDIEQEQKLLQEKQNGR
jgi:hypothetical protein